MTEKNKSKTTITTSDNDEPITISNRVTIAMLKKLSSQQRKKPETYLDDLIKHQYQYY